MGKKFIFCILFLFILLPLVFAYNYGEGNYSDSLYGTGYYVAPEDNTTNETSEELSATSSSGYSPKIHYLDETLFSNGNNFNLRYNDKINFFVNSANHTLTMQNFNSTTAKVVIQSNSITVYLQKGVLVELDLNNDSVNDVRVRYDGLNKTSARIFIQEIKAVSEQVVDDKSVVENFEDKKIDNFNWKLFWMVVLIIVILCLIIWKMYRKQIKEYFWINGIERSHRNRRHYNFY